MGEGIEDIKVIITILTTDMVRPRGRSISIVTLSQTKLSVGPRQGHLSQIYRELERLSSLSVELIESLDDLVHPQSNLSETQRNLSKLIQVTSIRSPHGPST